MRRLRLLELALGAFMVSAPFTAVLPARAADTDFEASPPEGFEDLAAERNLVLDVHFGGKKLGQTAATVSPGILLFNDPAALADMLPDLVALDAAAEALSGPLPTNSSRLCGSARVEGCGTLQPANAGIILDEDNFRVEIFLHPSLMQAEEVDTSFLDGPDPEPSLISLLGVTVSGSGYTVDAYHFQNRSIASVGALRLRSDSSVSSGRGLSFDNLTLEADRRSWRYTGGLFWAPGTDLVGRRRIAGIGIATQLDTRADKADLAGTPLTLFLQQPARVELIVDGKLISSQIYAAGHTLVDTANLPNGSYDVLLRIEEQGKSPREERRFFSKGSSMAPLGQPLFSATAGFLQAGANGLAFDSGTFFYEASAAYRVTSRLGLDATLVGTQSKAILEGGATLATRAAQVRVAALASSAGDYGVVLRGSTTGSGPLALSFDVRSVSSRDGRALLPITESRRTFSDEAGLGIADHGSFTQALAIVDYRFGFGALRLTGLYRKDESSEATYSIGTSLDVPIARSSRWDLTLQADARASDRGFSSFVGVRFRLDGAGVALSGTSGIAHDTERRGDSTRMIGETQAAWNREIADAMLLSTNAAIGRDAGGSYARASSHFRSPLLNARADLLHQFGESRGTQFAATLDSAIALTGNAVSIAGRQADDAAAVVAVSGGHPGQEFEVLVDEVVRGTVASNDRLVLFLRPYEEYAIRLRPSGPQIGSFDSASRTATFYPGNVVTLEWDVTPLVVLFGRAVDSAGRPIPFADVSGDHGIGRTDADGYFQIEVNREDAIQLTQRSGASCTLAMPDERPVNGYISAGEVRCH